MLGSMFGVRSVTFQAPIIPGTLSTLFQSRKCSPQLFSEFRCDHTFQSVARTFRVNASINDDQKEYIFQPSPFRKERLSSASKFHQKPQSYSTDTKSISDTNEEKKEEDSSTEIRFESHSDLMDHLRNMKGDPLEQYGGRIVTYRGNPEAPLVIVGEAPGAEEDRVGEPFVGRAGKQLDRIFAYGGFDMETQVYVTNIVRRRPPKNRNPTTEEMRYFLPYLEEELRLLKPKIVILAGRFAMEGLLGIETGISKVRGTWYKGGDEPLMMPIFHPAYLLRNSAQKVHMVTDIEEIRRKFMELVPEEKLRPLQKQK